MGGSSNVEGDENRNTRVLDLISEGIVQQSISLLPYIPNILIKLGSHGVLSVRLFAKGAELPTQERGTMRSEGEHVDVLVCHYPGLAHEGIVSVTGAGYCPKVFG